MNLRVHFSALATDNTPWPALNILDEDNDSFSPKDAASSSNTNADRQVFLYLNLHISTLVPYLLSMQESLFLQKDGFFMFKNKQNYYTEQL